MGKFSNFLRKSFIVTMVFLYSPCVNHALAYTMTAQELGIHVCDLKVDTMMLAEPIVNADKAILCPQNQYLYSCSDKVLGTQWLKGMKKTCDNTKFEDLLSTTMYTEDYYSYDSYDGQSSDSVNMENLRRFFRGTENIEYTDKNNRQQTKMPTEYIYDMYWMLSTFCIDENGHLDKTKIVCKTCPNNAKVHESYLRKNAAIGSLIWPTWNVYTIADCYFDEFEDQKGTYVYVPEYVEKNSANKQKCYNSKQVVTGSSLY